MTADELVRAYRALINKHYAAVQTDASLMFYDNWKLEKKAKMHWEEFRDLEKQFLVQLQNVRS